MQCSILCIDCILYSITRSVHTLFHNNAAAITIHNNFDSYSRVKGMKLKGFTFRLVVLWSLLSLFIAYTDEDMSRMRRYESN